MRAYSGDNSVQIAAQIDAGLATVEYKEIGHALVNVSVNDIDDGTLQADYETALAYILDTIHTRWPDATCYIMRFFQRGGMAISNTFAGYIGNVIATRPWCQLGPDERVFLENGDDGATYMVDSKHPNAAGYTLTAEKWRDVILGA